MKKMLVFWLLMACQVICCIALSLISPFFPPYAEEKGISSEVVGFIFSANPIGAVTASMVLGKILNQGNRFKFMMSGLFLQSVGLFLFVLTNYLEKTGIIIVAVTARLLNGFAASTYMTPLYSVLPQMFPKDVEKMLSIAEIFVSLGFLVGPVIGSFLYGLGGYTLPFYSFGILQLVLVPIISWQLNQGTSQTEPLILEQIQHEEKTVSSKKEEIFSQKKSIEISHKAHSKESQKGSQRRHKSSLESVLEYVSKMSHKVSIIREQQDDVLHQLKKSEDADKLPLSYLEVLSDYTVILTAIQGLIVSMMFNFICPITASYFQSQYGIQPGNVGYYMVVMAFSYTFTAFFVGNIKKGQKFYVFGASIIMGLSAFFAGPDKTFTHLSDNLYITMIGLGLIASAGSFLIIFTIPILNSILKPKYPKQPTQVANMASALFTSGTYLGELFGPALSGILISQYGFERTVSCLGFIILSFSVLYIPILFRTIEVPKEEDEKLQI